MENKILYLVSTPIGNLEEISSRAISTLSNVDFIACENPNNSIVLLNHLGIKKNLLQVNAIHELEMSTNIINKILEGNSIAFISDAGYPCISDPGKTLVKLAIENDVKIEVINGSSALLTALIASGLDASTFTFYGFLSSKEGTKENQIEEIKNNKETLIFYESSHRIQDTISSLYKILGDRPACIARELTKIHEEYIRGTLKSLQNLTENQKKGEFVIIVQGNRNEIKVSLEDVLVEMDYLVKNGLKTKIAASILAEKYKISKNALYNSYHK